MSIHGALTIKPDGTTTVGVYLRPQEIQALERIREITGIRSSGAILRVALLSLALGSDTHIRQAGDLHERPDSRKRRSKRTYGDLVSADPDASRLERIAQTMDMPKRRGRPPGSTTKRRGRPPKNAAARPTHEATPPKIRGAKAAAAKKRGRRPKGDGSRRWDKLDSKRRYEPPVRSQMDIWRMSERDGQRDAPGGVR
jgi:hypothetical protein